MAKGPDFIVNREDERRLQDLAHHLLDACREIVGQQASHFLHSPEGREMAAIDLATQTLFMADHLGELVCHEGGSRTMKARMLGVASGMGQIIGTTPDTIHMASDMAIATLTMQKAADMRHRDSIRQAARLKKEGKL